MLALALGLAAITVVGGPAGAHFCSTPLEVPVGRPVTFTVGVPAEDAIVGRVDIEVPPEFELHRPVEYPGWEVERDGDVVRFTGGPINLFQCAFFTLAGEVPEKATLVVPFTTYSPGGELVRVFRSRVLNHVDAAQLVYAGTDPASPSEDPHSSGSGVLALAGWALIGLALGGTAVVLVRRRRHGGSP